MSLQSVVGRKQCPKCRDLSKDNLILYSDGGSHCFSCGYHKGFGSTNELPEEKTVATETTTRLEQVFESRSVDATTLERYGVRLFESESGEASVGFPLSDASSKVATYHYRGVTAGALTREFWYTKGAKVKVPLFGWELVQKLAPTTVVVCEGETDTLALASVLRHSPDTVVVGAVGTGFSRKVAAWLSAKLKNQKLVLAFDNDRAGRQATSEVVAYLSNSRPNLKPHTLLFEAEDVGDAVRAGEDLQAALANAQPASSSSFLSAHAIADDVDDFIQKLSTNQVIRLGFSPTLDKAVRLQPGKLVGIIGESGCGKSTLAEHMLLETLNHPGARAMMLSAEMKAYEVALKLVSTREAFSYFDSDWLLGASSKDREDLRRKVVSCCNRFSISDEFGGMTVENLEQAVQEQIAVGNAPDLIVVDHLLAIAGELENTNLEQTAKALKAIARNCNTCVVVICHTRKPFANSGKGIWRPQKSDEYGSTGLGKYCDSMLGVALDIHNRSLLVETIKRERMGGLYADVTLVMENWQLHELQKEGHTSRDYTEEAEADYEQED